MQALLHIQPPEQPDCHVVKLPTEIAQIGCLVAGVLGIAADPIWWTTFPRRHPDGTPHPYTTDGPHRNHPLVRWAAASRPAFLALCNHGLALCGEHRYRWHLDGEPEEVHAAAGVLLWLATDARLLAVLPNAPSGSYPIVPSYPVAPEVAVPGDPHAGERNLLRAKFRGLAGIRKIRMIWTRREPPAWLMEPLEHFQGVLSTESER